MRKYFIHIIFMFVLGFMFSVIALNCVYLGHLWTSMDWIGFVISISGMVAPITALGMLYITYRIYKLNEESQRLETYFTKAVELYFNIEESFLRLEKVTNKQEMESCANDIKIHAVLLRRYLILFSKKSYSVRKINNVLDLIRIVPECKEYHKKLTEEFETFCLYSKYNNCDKSRVLNLKRNKDGIFEEVY